MSDNTAIEWTESTWNPVAGCSILSPGCTHCYAMGMAARIEKMMAALGKPTPYAGLTQPSKAGPVWNGRLAVASDETLTQPLRWKRPRRIFVNSMSDLFHEGVADETIDRIFAVMALSPQHTFQVLTKRAQRMREYLTRIDREPVHETARRIAAAWPGNQPIPLEIVFPLPNVWLGVSTEDQVRADERIPHLLATPAAKRFISAEPLLGALDLTNLPAEPIGPDECGAGEECCRNLRLNALENRSRWCEQGRMAGVSDEAVAAPSLDWVIAGGESGPRARPMHPDWVRSLRDQCAEAGVPYFFKQWGSWGPSSQQAWIDDDGSNRHMLVALDGRHGDTIADMITQPKGTAWMRRLGKKAAGAELDGELHREFPGGST